MFAEDLQCKYKKSLSIRSYLKNYFITCTNVQYKVDIK